MGFTQKLGLLAQGVYSDSSLNVGIGGAPSGSYKFETTGTAKISSTLLVSGVVTFGSTLSNGTYSYTLPGATGTLALTSDIHSAVTLSAIGSTANANGATLTGQVLNLQPADASFGGVVTTGTQTFAGAKTFSSQLTLSSTITNGTYTYTLPSATGTLALTSDLSGYLPLSGGTLTGALSGTSASFNAGITSVGASNQEITASATGDFFPRLKLIRTAGTTKTNRNWSFDLGSTGSLTLEDNTASATRLSIDTTGAATFSGVLKSIASGGYAGGSEQIGAGIVSSAALATVQAVARFSNYGNGYVTKIILSDNSIADAVISYEPSGTATSSLLGFGSGTAKQLTIDGNGKVTLTGALSGTSASFSSSVTATKFIVGTDLGYALNITTSGFGAILQSTGSSANIPLVALNSATSGVNNIISLQTDAGVERLAFRYDRTGDRIQLVAAGSGFLFTGAATFSSSVTSTINGVNALGSYGFTSYEGASLSGKNIVFGSAIFGGIDAIYQSSGNTNAFGIYLNGGTSTQADFYITNGGNVLIGTTTDSGYKLQVSGTFYSSAAISCGTSINASTTVTGPQGVRSESSSLVIPFTTWTTITTVDSNTMGMYLVVIGLANQTLSDWSATGILYSSGLSATWINGPTNGTLVQLRISGTAIQVYQSGGSPSQTLSYKLLKIM